MFAEWLCVWVGDVEGSRGGDVAGDSVVGGGWVGEVEAKVRSLVARCLRFLWGSLLCGRTSKALAEAGMDPSWQERRPADESCVPIVYLSINHSLLTGQATVYSDVK